MATPSLRVRRVGRRLELVVSVAVGGGDAHYGTVELDPQGLRRLLLQLRAHLWQLERAEAVTRATIAAWGLAP
jgi:hypothetical protein